MRTVFRTVVKDGLQWLVWDNDGRRVWLHPQARVGTRFRPGARLST